MTCNMYSFEPKGNTMTRCVTKRERKRTTMTLGMTKIQLKLEIIENTLENGIP